MLQNHKMYKHFWPLVTKSKNVIVGYLVPYTNKVVPYTNKVDPYGHIEYLCK